MSTWADLIADVQAQIDVTPNQAYAWLLDRARVMNADAAWLLIEADIPAVTGQEEYDLPGDCVRTEALTVNGLPYARSTLSQLDVAKAVTARKRIYADGVNTVGASMFAPYPPPTEPAVMILRYLQDVPDDRTGSPPFPVDIHGALSDGAIAMGLARMDERFDSAGYFEARFTDGVGRLRKRRNQHIGRGGTPIRIVMT